MAPVIFAVFVQGQGSLTPPGAPMPTMKTLDQVEARIPLAGGANGVTISADGSYYLTGNIAITSGPGINITANDVSLDLNGFTVSCADNSSGNSPGISYGGAGAFTLRNGHVRSTTTFSSNTFRGGGFSFGIIDGGNATSVRIEGVEVYGVNGAGIAISSPNAVISHCQTYVTAGSGIVASLTSSSIDHCVQQTCGGDGITGGTISDCYGASLTGRGINGSSVANCTGTTNSGTAIFASGAATNCTGTASTSGTGVSAVAVDHCAATCSGGVAINASAGTATGCYAQANGGIGILAANAIDCTASATGTNVAIQVSNAANCNAFCSGDGCGIRCVACATGCHATCDGNGTALTAVAATNCVVECDGTGSSAYSLDCGSNGVATNCVIFGNRAPAVAIKAYIATACPLNGGGATQVTYKYNMP